MQPLHPHRRRALIYFSMPILLIALCVIAGVSGAHVSDQKSHAAGVLNTLSGDSLLLAVIFIIPFFIYGVKFWRANFVSSELPPADAQLHSLSVQFSTGFFAKIFGNVFSPRGVLTWVNTDKVLKLAKGSGGDTTSVFEVPFGDVQKFEVDLNMIRLRVGGKSYTCSAYSKAVVASTVIGALDDSQLSTLALGKSLVDRAGTPELVKRLHLEGVRVAYTNVKKSIERGFDWGFGALFIGMLIVVFFVVK
jgi:hypothetical protein